MAHARADSLVVLCQEALAVFVWMDDGGWYTIPLVDGGWYRE